LYEGKHPLIGKRVAVKVLLPALSNETELVERFLSEARAVNEIRHRGIVDIFSFGTLNDGTHYFVMEYLDGHPFDRLIKNRAPIGVGETLQWLDEMLDALEAAHASGIVHRDIKPSNLFLVDTGRGRPYVKLLDFGIAKLGAFEGQAAAQTRASVIVGTPDYLAPEQARGKPISVQTDIYSLGVVAFEMLTGQRPFKGENALQTMWMHVESQAPAPSGLNASVPKSVDDLVLWAMEKEPNDRPKNAGDMRAKVAGLRTQYAAEPYVRSHNVNSRGVALSTPAPTSNKGLPRPPTPAPRSGKAAPISSRVKSASVSSETRAAPSTAHEKKSSSSDSSSTRISNDNVKPAKSSKSLPAVPVPDHDQSPGLAEKPSAPTFQSKAPLFAAVAVLLVLGGVGLFFATREPAVSPATLPGDSVGRTEPPSSPEKPAALNPGPTLPANTVTPPVIDKPGPVDPPVPLPPPTPDTKPDVKPETVKPVVVKPLKPATKPDFKKPDARPPATKPLLDQAQLTMKLLDLKGKKEAKEKKLGQPSAILRSFYEAANDRCRGAAPLDTDDKRRECSKSLGDLERQIESQ
jgi:eukaryotic-like serine/threonine-protein kinase